MLNKDITIIILAYKSAHIIKNCLKNIINKGYRIVVIDNGSNDNLEDVLTKNYKNSGIEVIFLENNVGFTRANNLVLRKVKTKYAFLLNPDAIINETSIDNMVLECDKDKEIAMVNPIFFGGDKLPNKKEIENKIKNLEKVSYVDFICCGASLMRMEIFKKIGFLDENLFLYADDDEISHRVRNNNYKNIVVRDAICSHINQGSSKTNNKWQNYKMLYFRSWHQGWGKTYLKRKNKNIIKIWLKIFHRLFLSLFYLLKFDLNKSINRFAIFNGSISNLISIDCFNKDNKIAKIRKKITL
jgi:GT2 family glycosyltransferase